MKLTFEDWKKECKRLLYEFDTDKTNENISYVDMDHYKEYYEQGLSPEEANEKAYFDAMGNE